MRRSGLLGDGAAPSSPHSSSPLLPSINKTINSHKWQGHPQGTKLKDNTKKHVSQALYRSIKTYPRSAIIATRACRAAKVYRTFRCETDVCRLVREHVQNRRSWTFQINIHCTTTKCFVGCEVEIAHQSPFWMFRNWRGWGKDHYLFAEQFKKEEAKMSLFDVLQSDNWDGDVEYDIADVCKMLK